MEKKPQKIRCTYLFSEKFCLSSLTHLLFTLLNDVNKINQLDNFFPKARYVENKINHSVKSDVLILCSKNRSFHISKPQEYDY